MTNHGLLPTQELLLHQTSPRTAPTQRIPHPQCCRRTFAQQEPSRQLLLLQARKTPQTPAVIRHMSNTSPTQNSRCAPCQQQPARGMLTLRTVPWCEHSRRTPPSISAYSTSSVTSLTDTMLVSMMTAAAWAVTRARAGSQARVHDHHHRCPRHVSRKSAVLVTRQRRRTEAGSWV